ncbi:MAG: serine/threonine-protein kinase [Gemmatimonadales bacterium]
MHLDLLDSLRQALADRYEIGGELGRGGMAVVCQARDRRHDRPVAIKVLHPDLAKAVGGERFLREISILARLSHPNILPLLDSGSFELVTGLPVPWYVMPLVRDETLRNRLDREGPLPVEVALRYTGELCAALAHAHAQGFIHRDIKPENILLQGGQAVLADFGIARAVTVAGGTTLTSTGLVVGTPAYMSPEQSIGGERLDPRSDLYSLGIVLYEMLAGHPPFTGATPQAISARHQFESPPPLSVVRPGLPAGVPAAVDRALSKVAADRFQSAEEFTEALRFPDDPSRSTRTLARRTARWWRPAAVVLLVVALAWALAPRLSGRVRLDSSRYVVLPFEVRLETGTTPIDGRSAQDVVLTALDHWDDVKLVSRLTVASRLGDGSAPLALPRALTIARGAGAGRLLWGEITRVGDSILVRGVLYDVNSESELRTRAVRLAPEEASISVVTNQLTELARGLVVPGNPTPENAAEALGAKSLEAYRIYQRGDSALDRWNLPLARRYYREALDLDPPYPNANLKLAIVGEWLDESQDSWRPFAERALATKQRLSKANRLMAEGLVHLGNDDPAACGSFRAVLALDSLDFGGWYGLGQCLLTDRRLVRDAASPSGYRFLASYTEGMAALTRALTVVPASHLAFGGAALQKIAHTLVTEPDLVRLGVTPDTQVYLAFPELRGDSTVFIPWPASEAASDRPPPATWLQAMQAGRERLLQVTSAWLRQFPESRPALTSHALALELARQVDGPGESALKVLERLRAAPEGATDVSLAKLHVRLLLKSGRVTAARALAESVLAVPPTEEDDGLTHAGLAALIGRKDRAADLMAQWYQEAMSTSDDRPITLPVAVRRDVQRLLVYAAFGEPEDSIRLIEKRIRAGITSAVPATERGDHLDAALLKAGVLAYPIIEYRSVGGYIFAQVERDLRLSQRDSARLRLQGLHRGVPDAILAGYPADFSLLEARLWLMLGDSARAASRLDLVFRAPAEWNTALFRTPTEAASIGRMMRLRAQLGRNPPPGLDTAAAKLWNETR